MKPADLTRLRTSLADRRKELRDRIARLQQELRDSTTAHADAADQAVASTDKNALHQQVEQATRQVQLLDVALRKMESDEYGLCAMCGREIGIRRLEAVPWAQLCVDCQELQEGMAGR